MGDRAQDGDPSTAYPGPVERPTQVLGASVPNPALQVREVSAQASQQGRSPNFLRPSAGGGCSVLPQVHSLPEAASDGVEGQGGTQPVASNLLERLSPTRIKNIWRVKKLHVFAIGEQKIGKANMHTSPIPTVGLLLPIYVISCAYFKIVRRAGGMRTP